MKLLKRSPLGKLDLWKTAKSETGFFYEIRLRNNLVELLWGGDELIRAYGVLEHIEKVMYPHLIRLKQYELGTLKLNKNRLKNLILKAFDNNFERIKKLKEYGVIK